MTFKEAKEFIRLNVPEKQALFNRLTDRQKTAVCLGIDRHLSYYAKLNEPNMIFDLTTVREILVDAGKNLFVSFNNDVDVQNTRYNEIENIAGVMDWTKKENGGRIVAKAGKNK